jgi:hypothetical protein
MDVGRPHRALVPTVDGDVVTVLAGTTRPLTGRDVARMTGRQAHSGVLRALTRLTEQGLVHREEAGRALLYVLNREHLAAPAVDVLADMRGELLRRIAAAGAEWSPEPAHLSVFGSAARGDGDSDSDIDVFVVRPAGVDGDDSRWVEQIDALAASIRRWTGNAASVAQVSQAELRGLVETGSTIVDGLRLDAVTLIGPKAESLLEATR